MSSFQIRKLIAAVSHDFEIPRETLSLFLAFYILKGGTGTVCDLIISAKQSAIRSNYGS